MNMPSTDFTPDHQRAAPQLAPDEGDFVTIPREEYEMLCEAGYDPEGGADGRVAFHTEDLNDEQHCEAVNWGDNIDGPEARALTFGYVIADNLQSDDERRQRAAEKRAVGVFRDREVLVRELRAALAINDSDERELHLLALAEAFADVETGPDFSYPEDRTDPDGFQLGSAVMPLKPVVRI